jgi:hypothetical protein
VNPRRVLLLAAALGMAGCSEHRSGAPAPDSSATSPAQPAARLALKAGSTEVWFTLAQNDSGPDGACVERTLEIRRDSARIPVPLLYTGEPPVQVNDSTVRASLWRNCRPYAPYLIDLRTGQPRLEKR